MANDITLSPENTTIEFTAKKLFGFITVKGSFDAFAGTLVEGDELAEARVDLRIDVTSLSTDNPKRDEHLKSADFFDVAQHPALDFTSTTAKGTRENFELEGHLVVQGTQHPVTLKVVKEGARYAGTATLSRRRLGIDAMPTFVIKENVELRVTVAVG
ncbi:MAG: YceI family protein [Myxococcota bacterium]